MKEQRARRLLEEKLAELIDEDRLGDADRATVELDQEAVGRLSRIDALQVQAMAEAQARRRSAARDRIRAALARLDQGDFGYCLECGDEIAEKRLQHDPSVTHCVNCAA